MGPRAGLDRCGKSRPDEYSIRGPYNPWRITTTPSRPKILWRYRHEYSFDLPLAKHQWPHCLSKSRSNKAILYDLAQNWRNICFSSSEGRGIEILLQMYIHLHVKCSLLLSDFKQTWIFSTDFRKIHKWDVSWKSVRWKSSCSLRTDRHDEANSRSSQFYERSSQWLNS